MNAKYDFTPDERGEVVLDSAKGTWLLSEKGSNNKVATGTLAVSKK